MAGMDDYQFYTDLRQSTDNPFWEQTGAAGELALARQTFDARDCVQALQQPPKPPSFADSTASIETSCEPGDVAVEKHVEHALDAVSVLAENVLSHPFIVLRRICQVDVSSGRYHVLPVTVLYAAVRSGQGGPALFRGLGSVLLAKGFTLCVEDAVSKFSSLPKELHPGASARQLCQHLALKAIALGVAIPLGCVALVDTVRWGGGEEAWPVDMLKDAAARLLAWGLPGPGRLMPLYLLLVPTVGLGLLRYVVSSAATTLTTAATLHRRRTRLEQERVRGAVPRLTPLDAAYRDGCDRMTAGFVGAGVADTLLYPLDTVVCRLQLQGTRTIIDSLDSGYQMKPILTRYTGFWSCVASILDTEGYWGFFKGFGAVTLQYLAYYAVTRLAQFAVREVCYSMNFSQRPVKQLEALPPAPPPGPVAPPTSTQPANRDAAYMPRSSVSSPTLVQVANRSAATTPAAAEASHRNAGFSSASYAPPTTYSQAPYCNDARYRNVGHLGY